jgi:lactoylglutathione lyase
LAEHSAPASNGAVMQYLHTMIRIRDVDESLRFFCDLLGMSEVRRKESEAGRFTLIFLAASADRESAESSQAPLLELTYNWDPQEYGGGRNFGHLAYRVEDIYQTCQRLQEAGITINRPPRDGYMAFIKSPDGISIELLQAGEPLPAQEPWASMASTGSW